MWGFADVGADIYVALGLVVVAAQGAAPLAFALAGLVYIMIGLAYSELASTYPVAGGGQYFTLRGLGDIFGFVSGSALLLDYTIDIALFAVASTGYLNAFIDIVASTNLTRVTVALGPLDVHAVWLFESLSLISGMIWLNILGIRESSRFNELIGGVSIVTEVLILVFGLLFAWKPDLLSYQWQNEFPKLSDFAYGTSLAIISFVGLESISQAAQETRRPATIIPRTSVTLVFTVFLFAVGFSTLALGILPWQQFDGREEEAVRLLAEEIPFVGVIAGVLAATLGAAILAISANAGVMSASRVTYSMSRYDLLPGWFTKVHARFHTPARTIVVFSLMGIAMTIAAFLTASALETLANLYAFGATLGYTLVFVSLLTLRFTDPYSPRPFKMPLNLRLPFKGRGVDFPVLGTIGMIGVATIFVDIMVTHAIGRIAGPLWVVAAFVYYVVHRRRSGLPVGTIKRDWEQDQIDVLTSAEEFELLEEYKAALQERDAARRG